jgi:hypothetical protein
MKQNNVLQPDTGTGDKLPGWTGMVDTAGLMQHLPLCRRSIFMLRKQGKLPYIKLGAKVLFHLPSVQEALLRMQRNGGGQ